MKRRMVWILTYGVVVTGFLLIGLSIILAQAWPIWATAFLRDVGLLLAAVTGATLLHEKMLRDDEKQAFTDELNSILESRIPPQMSGLRLLREVRRYSAEYSSWIIERKPQSLFFAGRSVLHRIDSDVRSRGGDSAEQALLRRLLDGSKITILFLDPRVTILDRLANEAREPATHILANIRKSLEVCRRLALLLKDRTLPAEASLTIRIYDRIPYLAYHKQDDQVIIGFYFPSSEGCSTESYEVVDKGTEAAFAEYFRRIQDDQKSSLLIRFNGSRLYIEEALFEELNGFLDERLGPNPEPPRQFTTVA
jgi:hypothetical protein